jgi:hypothetical protein
MKPLPTTKQDKPTPKARGNKSKPYIVWAWRRKRWWRPGKYRGPRTWERDGRYKTLSAAVQATQTNSGYRRFIQDRCGEEFYHVTGPGEPKPTHNPERK